MTDFTEVLYDQKIIPGTACLLAGDIGGTNSNFGFFADIPSTTPPLLFSLHAKSKKITDFTQTIIDLLQLVGTKYQIVITKAGFASAGIVTPQKNYSKPTNAPFVIDGNDIKNRTGLNCLFVVNDFEVIGYGLDQIAPQSLVNIKTGTGYSYGNKAIIGAGTGLGKCILHWNSYAGRYIPIASEGGHADFCAQNQRELDLVNYIRKTEKRLTNVSWEDLLSGAGIQRIYSFFHDQSRHTNPPSSTHPVTAPLPDEIFKSRNDNPDSFKTFELYTQIYGRCAKNFALDVLALNGVYIAGGIAAKNLPLFEMDIFFNEFLNCGKQYNFLKQVPLYVIIDYNISLYGVIRYMLLEEMCIL